MDLTGLTAQRRLAAPLESDAFLLQPLARSLVESGKLTAYRIAAPQLVESDKLSFVTYPYEWTHGQLHAAAQATLDIAAATLADGWELKDATAFNIIFRGMRPEFCDHLSFRRIARRDWWAYGQFVRHFVAPLALSRLAGWPVASSFRAQLDGVTPATARRVLGWRRWRHRVTWALLERQETAQLQKPATAMALATPLHQGLFRFLQWQLDGLVSARAGTPWASYESERPHYEKAALAAKRVTVARWLEQLRAQRVTDLGCNSGEFSAIALANGATQVIAADADHDSLEALRKRFAGDLRVHSVWAPLDDLAGGRGWMEGEFPGLLGRLQAQAGTTLALALIHHLAIGRSVPLPEVARLLACCTREHLIVEVLDSADPRVLELKAQRARDNTDQAFTLQGQRDALGIYFDTVDQLALPGDLRQLLLLKRRATATP